MRTFRAIAAIIGFALMPGVSSAVYGQACGYSINTFYVTDQKGKVLDDVSIRLTMKDPRNEYNGHFEEASMVYRDSQRNAYVYQHGLCSAHQDLVLEISAKASNLSSNPLTCP